jgi:hypothetical protein
MLCSTACFGAKTTACEQTLRSERKKIYFFLSSFPERMFREVTGRAYIDPRCAGPTLADDKFVILLIKDINGLRPLGKSPNVHYDTLHRIGWLVP